MFGRCRVVLVVWLVVPVSSPGASGLLPGLWILQGLGCWCPSAAGCVARMVGVIVPSLVCLCVLRAVQRAHARGRERTD